MLELEDLFEMEQDGLVQHADEECSVVGYVGIHTARVEEASKEEAVVQVEQRVRQLQVVM